MRTLKIDFASAKLLPDGCDAGYVGEHNATEITIIPPVEMAECESIATYIVAFATSSGVLYSDSFLKSEEITVSLTSKLTTDYYLGVQLEGYDSEGRLVVKSPLVTQLQLSPSARGTGTENDGGSINGNIPVIGGNVTMGSKYYANDWAEGAIIGDVYSSPSITFAISEAYPENRIITDISVKFMVNGEEKEYRFFKLITTGKVSGHSNTVLSKTPVYDESCEMHVVAYITESTTNSPLYHSVMSNDADLTGFTVHYLEV